MNGNEVPVSQRACIVFVSLTYLIIAIVIFGFMTGFLAILTHVTHNASKWVQKGNHKGLPLHLVIYCRGNPLWLPPLRLPFHQTSSWYGTFRFIAQTVTSSRQCAWHQLLWLTPSSNYTYVIERFNLLDKIQTLIFLVFWLFVQDKKLFKSWCYRFLWRMYHSMDKPFFANRWF